MTSPSSIHHDATGYTATSAPNAPSAPVDPTAPRRFEIEDELSFRTRQQLKLRVVDALAEGARAIVLDASGCGYIDSSGLGVLVSINKKCRDAGGAMTLEGLNPELRYFLAHVGLDTVFAIVPPITDDDRNRA